MTPRDFDPQNGPIIDLPDLPNWERFGIEILADHRYEFHFLSITLDKGVATVIADVATQEFAPVLLDLVASRPDVARVVDRIRVTGHLVPANRTDIGAWAQAGADMDDDNEISRYPSVRPIGHPQVGSLFEIEIDLAPQPDEWTQDEPIRIEDLDEGWEELSVNVRLLCRELDVADADLVKVIVLRRDAASEPCRFVGRVNARAETSGLVSVTVIFEHKGRFSGSASSDFALIQTDAPAPAAPVRTPSTSFGVVRRASAPGMTVIIKTPRHDGHSDWLINCPELGGFIADATVDLDVSPREHFRQLFTRAQFYREDEHEHRLQTIGENLWQVAPLAFRDAYIAARKYLGDDFPIQFITDDLYVPWEMMRPTNLDGCDHLFMAHPVARWPVGAMANRFAPGRIVSFVPSYTDGALPAADEERRFVEDELGGTLGRTTRRDFLDFMRSGEEQIQIVHFAGHGSVEGSADRGLRFEDDRWVSLEDLNSSITLGRNNRSLFVLNACAVGSQDVGLVAESWPLRLIQLEFGGVIAPLWAVQDANASLVVRSALRSFQGKGASLGEAMRSARAEHRSGSATPFAYLCFGDVMAYREV